MYRDHRLEVRLTAQDLDTLDQKRGQQTRSGFLRDLIHANLNPEPIRPTQVPKRTATPVAPEFTTPPAGHRHQFIGKYGNQHCRVCGQTPAQVTGRT